MTKKDEKTTLDIWDALCDTDPRFTKKVDFGRGFTSTDAYYIIKKVTEYFGPVGIGWGWKIKEISYPGDCVLVRIQLWHGNRQNTWDALGQVRFRVTTTKGQTKEDDESAKKALTNAICKGVSYLGVSADVYEGRFDDDKYVEAQRKKYERATAVEVDEMGDPEEIKAEILGDLWLTKSWKEAKENVWDFHRKKLTFLEKNAPEVFSSIRDEFSKYTEKFDDHPVKGKEDFVK